MKRCALLVIFVLFWLPACQERQKELSLQAAPDKAARLDERFRQVRLALGRARAAAETLLSSPEKYPIPLYPERVYAFYENTLYYATGSQNKGAIVATGRKPVDEALKRKVRLLENMEPVLQQQTASTPWIAMAWYGDAENIAVFDPPFDLLAFVPPRIDIPKDILPYRLAAETFPPGKSVWLDPYIDITGKGYMVTVSEPVQVGGKLAGVVGNDISVSSIAKDFASPEYADSLLVSQRNYVVAAGKEAANLLNLSALGDFYYLKQVEKDTPAPETFLLENQRETGLAQLASGLTGGAADIGFSARGKSFLAHVTPLPETGWHLIDVREK